VIDTQTWRIAAEDKAYAGNSYGVAFAPDGRLYTVAYDHKLRQYGPGPGFKKDREVSTKGDDRPFSIAVDPLGKLIAVGFRSNRVAVLIIGVGLGIALLHFGRWTGVFGGAVVGGGIAAMHYTGMMALEVPGGWVSTSEDITESREAQAQISHMAHHDALTGLANRTRLIKKLENALAALPLRGGSIAVHFIDLDRFKTINDTLGHDGGDFLLKTIAERLDALTRTDDMVARLGGDEFVVVQTGVTDEDQARDFATRLASAVTEPMKFGEQAIIATESIGVALAPADGTNPERLLKSADLALYKAKPMVAIASGSFGLRWTAKCRRDSHSRG